MQKKNVRDNYHQSLIHPIDGEDDFFLNYKKKDIPMNSKKKKSEIQCSVGITVSCYESIIRRAKLKKIKKNVLVCKHVADQVRHIDIVKVNKLLMVTDLMSILVVLRYDST